MLNSANKYKRLIIKHIQGETTPDEQKLAEAWISGSPANRRLYETYKGLLLLTGSKNVSFDTDQAWNKLHERIRSSRGVKPVKGANKLRIPVYRAAAGVAAVLLIAFGLFSILQQQPSIKQYSSSATISGPLSLPDGSVVVLNKNTSVSYPDHFSGNSREISIFGEAFFEISPDRENPFVVHASGLDIRVVGTSFNVEAKKESGFVRVTVNTGQVLVYPSGTGKSEIESAGMLLSAGEMATFSAESGRIVRGVNDDLNFLSWKTGILTFREARLADVLKALENKYQTRFIVDNQEVLNQRLTARFEKESLDEVLETLSLIFNFRTQKRGQMVILH